MGSLQNLWETAELGLEVVEAGKKMLQIIQVTVMANTSRPLLLGTDYVACPEDTTNTEFSYEEHRHYCLWKPVSATAAAPSGHQNVF